MYYVEFSEIVFTVLSNKALVPNYQQSACSLDCFDVRNFTVM